jgi:hypothetical protein
VGCSCRRPQPWQGVANAVYTELTRDGRPDSARAADALHQAICALRQQDRTNNPLLWAPYIHLGN